MRRFVPLRRRLVMASAHALLVAALAQPSGAQPILELRKPWDSSPFTQFGAHYGQSVSTAGDVNGDGYSDFIVGTPDYEGRGRVHLYLGSSDPFMSEVPAWTAEGTTESARFGAAVAFAGDVNGDGFADVLVGAPFHFAGEAYGGQVALYLGSSSGLGAAPAWTVWSGRSNARLGASVACAGDVNRDGYDDVIVGEPGSTVPSDTGRVAVYLGSSSGLSAIPSWAVQSEVPGDLFGASVASAGDVNADGYADVIVGAPNYVNGQYTEGRAVMYLGSPSGLAATAAWSAEGDLVEAVFGISVSTAGDVNGDGYSDVIVGASGYYDAGILHGRAFVYFGSAAGLSVQPMWSVHSDQGGSGFGFAVATAGDVNSDGLSDVIVGAPNYDTDYGADAGAAFLYFGTQSGPETTVSYVAKRQQHHESVGYSVGPAGDVNGDGFSDFIVGGPKYDYQDPNTGITYGGSDVGRAMIWAGGAVAIRLATNGPGKGDQQRAHYGAAVSTAGDVNGDGFSDLLVGAPYFDNGQADEGRAYAYLGSGTGLSAAPAWAVESDQASARLGSSLANAGDVNGDGYADVLVGVPFYDDGDIDEGRVSVYLGSSAGLSATPAAVFDGNQPGAQFGASVASAGDVNADGYADVLIGAPGFDNGQTDEGRVFLFLGSPSGLVSTPAWTAESDQVGAAMGYSLGTAGDVNRDGYSDVIIGTPRWDGGQADEGRADVYLGSASGLGSLPAWSKESDDPGALYGSAVATAGDANGDGYSDVMVGAPKMSDWQFEEGVGFLYFGSPSGLPTSASWSFQVDEPTGELGHCVGTIGDLNGDGYSDIVVGSQVYDYGQPDEGLVWLFFGSPGGPPSDNGNGYSLWSAQGDQLGALFGAAVGTAGDVNADGYADFVFGAPYFDAGQLDEGKAFLYMGNGFGAPRLARQWQPDGSALISPLGKSLSTAFRAGAVARSPAGRGRVRIECEVKPLGVPFDGTGLITQPEIDTGPPIPGVGSVATLNALVTGLAPETPYRWRYRFFTNSPLYPRSPWIFFGHNGAGEADLRTGSGLVGVAEPGAGSDALRIEGIRPNPSRSGTAISYRLPHAGSVRLTIHDLQGRAVKRLVDGARPAGSHTVTWEGREEHGKRVRPGVYWVRLELEGVAVARKLVRE